MAVSVVVVLNLLYLSEGTCLLILWMEKCL